MNKIKEKKLKNESKIEEFAQKTGKKAKGFLSEFKKFAFKGNVVDLAIAVVIGAAFGAIVSSLVNDIIMPWISLLIGDVSFVDLKWVLKPADLVAGKSEIAFRYGNFLQKIFEFLIITFSIFIVVKIWGKAQEKLDENKQKEEKSKKVEKNQSETLLTEIRDLLKENNAKNNQKNKKLINQVNLLEKKEKVKIENKEGEKANVKN